MAGDIGSISSVAVVPVTTGPVAPAPAVAPVGAQGGGGSLPPTGEAVPQAATPEALGAAVEQINQFLRANAREFVFQLDLSSGKSRVTIVNPQTGDVVRQIPDPHVLQLAQGLESSGLPLTGLLLNSQA